MVRITSLAVSGLALLTGLASAATTRKDVKTPEFRTFSVPEHPHHKIRIKEQSDELCDAGSRQWTGWLDTGGKHLFFWYFESLNDPKSDPLSLWMTGGPGGSGLVGLMLELGPCLINENGTGTNHNPYAWNSNTSMIFIDQPAGTGLSYHDHGVTPPATSATAAEDMNVFLRIFYSAFPHLAKLPFHIAGESYGGHYVPALAAEILRYNTGSPAPAFQIPLSSIMIGNGYVSPADTTWGFYDTLCTTKPGVPEPVFNESSCALIADALPRCMRLQEACYAFPDPIICSAAGEFCFEKVDWLYYRDVKTGGRNPFDITRPCEIDDLCYGAGAGIEAYIRSEAVLAALEVPESVGRNFSLISMGVNQAFTEAGDPGLSTEREVRFVLESGVDVLVYNGDLDLACNTAGNVRWTEKLGWAGQVEFTAKDFQPWFAKRGGEVVRAGRWKEVSKVVGGGKKARFAFVTVEGSGHMVPLDQPEAGLQMVRNWLFEGFEKAAKGGMELAFKGQEKEFVSLEL
ncbi:Carboxypeptidase Y-like protein [Colletotrichum chlorophyti]|uniref:Carboxypeptidase n=1 Tax=Colletotrichum chlorophyti TaxID=708187 RepID=A0A1Q8S599_9PEZI|nr:Carboxypeptidase Y-like protein [Colletotrichum chlorophyti]